MLCGTAAHVRSPDNPPQRADTSLPPRAAVPSSPGSQRDGPPVGCPACASWSPLCVFGLSPGFRSLCLTCGTALPSHWEYFCLYFFKILFCPVFFLLGLSVTRTFSLLFRLDNFYRVVLEFPDHVPGQRSVPSEKFAPADVFCPGLTLGSFYGPSSLLRPVRSRVGTTSPRHRPAYR